MPSLPPNFAIGRDRVAPARTREPTLLSRWVVALGVVVVAGTVGILGWALLDARADAWREEATNARNIVHGLQREIARTLDVYDLSIQTTINNEADPSVAALPDMLRRRVLFDGAANAPFLEPLVITNETGMVVEQSRPGPLTLDSLADTPAFETHREREHAGLLIGAPTRFGPVDAPTLALSRRRVDGDDAFKGVVAGAIQLEYFRDLFGKLRLNQGAVFSLLSADGLVLLRMPDDGHSVGRNVRAAPVIARLASEHAGQYEAISTIDNVARLITYAQVGQFPLVVVFSVPVDGIYVRWRHKAIIISAVACVLLSAGGWLAMALARELRLRRRAEREARFSAIGYKLLTENSSDMIERLGMDGAKLYVSPSVTSVLGYTAEEMTGLAWRAILHGEDLPKADAALAELRDGVPRVTVSYRVRRRDGTEAWLESRITLMRDPVSGAPEGLIANTRDITRRKQTEDELSRTADAFATLAATDGLTGLANRRAFDERLRAEWVRAIRAKSPVSLLLVDADHFKRYNDTYGHLAGDDALRRIARCIGVCINRPDDLAARYGGEEFAVLLPATDTAGARHIAEHLCVSVAAMAVAHAAGSTGVVTVSIGVATLRSGQDDETSALIAAADAALYAAKARGRNQVAIWSETLSSAAGPALPGSSLSGMGAAQDSVVPMAVS